MGPKPHIRVESASTGYVEVMTRTAFYKRFGRVEGMEILQGYGGNILAFATDQPLGEYRECPVCEALVGAQELIDGHGTCIDCARHGRTA